MNQDSRAAWRGSLAMILGGVGVLAVAAAVFLLVRQPAPSPVEILPPATPASSPTPAPSVTPVPTPRPLRVDVAGAVVAPGVYTLPPDAIVADAIAMAGGAAEDADLDRLNKAVALADGVQVYVPHKGQTPPPTLAPPIPPTLPARTGPVIDPAASLVNINTAQQADLEALPGIGPVLAERIVAGRPYAKIDDLLEVQGIGPALFARLSAHITVQ